MEGKCSEIAKKTASEGDNEQWLEVINRVGGNQENLNLDKGRQMDFGIINAVEQYFRTCCGKQKVERSFLLLKKVYCKRILKDKEGKKE